jgi:hypothetical protein
VSPRSPRVVAFVAAYLAYVVGVSLAVGFATPERSVLDLGFDFGPAIARVVHGEGLADGTRLPLIPYFLGTISHASEGIVFASLAKNLVVQTFLGVVLWNLASAPGSRIDKVLAAGYLLTFPQLARHGFALVPEEGYLIALTGFVFAGLLRTRRGAPAPSMAPYALALGLMVMTKSGALLVSFALAALFVWRSRRLVIALTFGIALAIATLGVGANNARASGHFAVTSSLDGYNFWKGNNERTLEYFPSRSLDGLSDAAPAPRLGEDEWAWNRRCFEEGLRFNRDRPREALRIFGWRLYQVFFSISAEEPVVASRRTWLRTLGVPHMIVFRFLLWACICWAARTVWKHLRRRRHATSSASPPQLDVHESVEPALAYLVFLGCFVAPYLVAWGVQRRLMPLVVPTVLYAITAIRLHRQRT